jgi:hypothetical protein
MLMWVSLFVAMAMRLTHGGQLFDQTSGQDSKINLTLHRVLCVSQNAKKNPLKVDKRWTLKIVYYHVL